MKTIAIVRVRGRVNVTKKIEDTMKMLHLNSVNNFVIIPENKHYLGMLQKIKDYVTYGYITEDTFKEVLMKRGKIEGDKSVTEDYLKEKKTSVNDLFTGKVKAKDIGIKQPFRLPPPKKGYEGIKKPFTMKGALGNRKEEMDKLVQRMI